uniref:Glycosyltransferase RgtA/B/C/D-like domain-containing protein n=1 Tax=Schlesneria paludicola TaxID=360056 RepID=A0A7C4QUN5_9PLAN
MSGAVVEPPPLSGSEPPAASLPPLEDRLPAEWKWSRRCAGATLLLGCVYLWFSVKPLWHTDLWGHLTYGRWIVAHGRLPATEPLLPLSKGMPFVDTAWLSQVLGYLAYQGLGLAGLQGLSALVIAAASGLLLHRCYQRTRHVGFAVLGLASFLWLDWYTFAVVRPQLLGLLCFCWLLHRLTAPRATAADWWLIPALHGLWANLHGSFVLGLGLLAAFAAGRGVDLLRRTGTWRAVAHDQRFRRWGLWLELSAAAALVNPYGLGLYLEVWRFGRNANLASLTEWQILDVHAPHGWLFLGSVVGLTMLYRFTPRRVAAWEVLTLVGLGVASLGSARLLSWWGPVAALLLVTHGHASVRRWCPWRAMPAVSPRNGKWTVVTLGLIWICLGYSPLGMRVLHRKEPALEKAVSDYTPLGAVNYLREKPPSGLVFNVYEWGDYLLWAGPPNLQVFVNSHAHLVPREVWLHYLQVVDVDSGWEEVLERYGVTTVVVDPRHRSALIRRLKDHAAWQVAYEDRRSVVFVRQPRS